MARRLRFLFASLTAFSLGQLGDAGAQSNAPSSAIPWLSDVIATAPILADPIVPTTVEQVTVTPLETQGPVATGVLDADQLGLPEAIWADSTATEALDFVQTTPYGGPPSARALLRGILIARLDEGADFGSAYHLARVDRLLEIGALDEADALLDAINTNTPALLGRFFDVSLLTHRPQRACKRLAEMPAASPSRDAQVFCLAIQEDWEAADVALELGLTLGEIDADMGTLLAFFLDAGLLEDLDGPAPLAQPTAFEVYLRDSIGLPRGAGVMPAAFAHADLAKFIPVRFQIEAGEKLVADGALSHSILFASYRQEEPAASGGVWDRADAVQKFDRASLSEDMAVALRRMDREFDAIGLRTALAREYAAQLERKLTPGDLPQDVWPIVARLLLLGDRPAKAHEWLNEYGSENLATAVAIVETDSLLPFMAGRAVDIGSMTQPGALKHALSLLAQEREPDAFLEAIGILDALGLKRAAKSIALEKLLDPKGSYG